MTRKSIKARIDEEIAILKERPREGEAGIGRLPGDDWGAVSKTALALREDDESLEKLFAAADLDPNNPFHWAALARVLANIRFGSNKPAGRPHRWGPMEYCQLLNDLDRVKHQHPKWSIGQVCQSLVKDNERYKDLNARTLTRQFSDAVNPKKNSLLQSVLDGRDENDWLKRRRKRGWGMKASVSVRQLMLDEIITAIMSGWRKIERE